MIRQFFNGAATTIAGFFLTFSAVRAVERLLIAKKHTQENATFGVQDYVDYDLSASVNGAEFDVNLTWSDAYHNDNDRDNHYGMALLTISQCF